MLCANCMVKSKAADSGCLRVNVEEKLRVHDWHKILLLFHPISQAQLQTN